MAKAAWIVAVMALAGCASAGEPGWINTGESPFETARMRCQIETQVVDGPAWETCMVALGWRREPTPHAGGYDLIETKVEIAPDMRARRIEARQMTQLRAEMELSELRFDASALYITSATADDAEITWRTEGDALVLRLPRTYHAGEAMLLRIAYAGAPPRGLVFDDGAIYTSYFTCDWMLCALDRPGDAFQFSIDVSGPAAPAMFSSQGVAAYPAHVQGFGFGAWTQVRDSVGAVDLIYASAHASEADLRAMFADTPRMLGFFERKAGVPFPNPAYTQLLVEGDAAQEGGAFAILGDEVVRPILTDPHEDWAIAHELAHSYWGNLISPKDWSHFWLSEGLTTFMVAAWKQERWGDADYQREIELATARWARARDAGWDRPLAFAEAYPDLRTRRAIQYSKGMLFFVELRRVLGEDAFWNGVAAYTRAHAGGTVESADMQRAMEGASGRDLDALFAEWVYP